MTRRFLTVFLPPILGWLLLILVLPLWVWFGLGLGLTLFLFWLNRETPAEKRLRQLIAWDRERQQVRERRDPPRLGETWWAWEERTASAAQSKRPSAPSSGWTDPQLSEWPGVSQVTVQTVDLTDFTQSGPEATGSSKSRRPTTPPASPASGSDGPKSSSTS